MTALLESLAPMVTLDVISQLIPTLLLFIQVGKPILDRILVRLWMYPIAKSGEDGGQGSEWMGVKEVGGREETQWGWWMWPQQGGNSGRGGHSGDHGGDSSGTMVR